jgi:hypothetical protein
MRKTGEQVVHPIQRGDLECASDDDIDNADLDWVRRNLVPTFGYLSGVSLGSPELFDIRDEVLDKFVGLNVRHGDVLQDMADQEKMVCVGVRPTNESSHGRAVQLQVWFHVDGKPGAGISPNLHKNRSRYIKIGTRPLQEQVLQEGALSQEQNSAITRMLQPTLEFPQGLRETRPKFFDIRPEIVNLFWDLHSGQVFDLPGNVGKLTVIGVATDDSDGRSKLWFHCQGTNGAGLLADEHELHILIRQLTDTQRDVDLEELKKALMSPPEIRPGLLQIVYQGTNSPTAPRGAGRGSRLSRLFLRRG